VNVPQPTVSSDPVDAAARDADVEAMDTGTAELGASMRALELAKGELAAAERDLSRQKELHAMGEPKADMDRAQAARDAAARELRRAQERLEILRASAASPKVEPAECFRLGGPPGWFYGTKGDVLCFDARRFVVLLRDGTWDGWDVRWESAASRRRAHVQLRSSVFWDVGTDVGDAFLEPDGRGKIPLLPLSADDAAAAKKHLEQADTTSCSTRLRACFDKAPPEIARVSSADDYYSVRACQAMLRTLSCPP
jgi:hypothetical protein